MLLTGIMPNLLASKGYAGREKVMVAFEKYFATNGHQNGSYLTKVREQILSQEFGSYDTPRFECVNGVALLAKTIPTAFWTMYYVFSDPVILETVRTQVTACLTINEEGGEISRVLDVNKIRGTTVLTSILHESLRHRTSGTGVPMVVEDILLDKGYLLKKDSFLVLSNHKLHFNESVWGGKAKEFDCQRFSQPQLKLEEDDTTTLWRIPWFRRRRQHLSRPEICHHGDYHDDRPVRVEIRHAPRVAVVIAVVSPKGRSAAGYEQHVLSHRTAKGPGAG